MEAIAIQELFQSTFTFFHSVVLLAVAHAVALLLLSPIIANSSKPEDTIKAFFFHMLQLTSIALMSYSIVPTVLAILAIDGFDVQTYFGLLLIFAIGGILFLWADANLRDLDDKAGFIPSQIYLFIVRTVSYCSLILGFIAIAIAVVNNTIITTGWWILPSVAITYGGFLGILAAPDYVAKPAIKQPVKKTTRKKKK